MKKCVFNTKLKRCDYNNTYEKYVKNHIILTRGTRQILAIPTRPSQPSLADDDQPEIIALVFVLGLKV